MVSGILCVLSLAGLCGPRLANACVANRVENKLRTDLTLLLVGGWVLRSWRPLAIALVMSRESYCEKKCRTSNGGGAGLGAGPFEAWTGGAAPTTAKYEHVYLRVWEAHRIEYRRRGMCTNSKHQNACLKMKLSILFFSFRPRPSSVSLVL